MEISTDMFWWDKSEKEFRQEASTLQIPPGTTFNKGITLRNPKTDGTNHFYYVCTHYSNEGEVTHWSFTSKDCSMLIWND